MTMIKNIPIERDQNVSFLKRPRRFTLEQARRFVPVLDGITFVALERSAPLMEKLKAKGTEDEKKAITEELQEIVALWSEQVLYLGAITRGLWMVDFDCGDGFYTWVFGEDDVSSYRKYHQAFHERVPIPPTPTTN